MRHIYIILLYIFMLTLPILLMKPIRDNNSHKVGWVNNGNRATTFVYRCQPFYVFSEDFHLYFLRAKRVLQRGFNNDLFSFETYKLPDLRNIFQILICLPFILTNGETSLVFFCYYFYLLGSFLLFYRTTRFLTSNSVLRFFVVVVIITFLGTRYYRVSTFLFSAPILLIYFSNILHFFGKTNSTGKKNFLLQNSLALFLLLNIDFWAALIALSYGITLFFFNFKNNSEKFSKFKEVCFLGIPIVFFVVINMMVNNSDISIRSGVKGFQDNQVSLFFLLKSSFYYPYYLLSLILVSSIILFFGNQAAILKLLFIIGLPYLLAYFMIIVLHSDSGQTDHFFYFQSMLLIYLCAYTLVRETRKTYGFNFIKRKSNLIFVITFVFSVLTGFFVSTLFLLYVEPKQSVRGISSFSLPTNIEEFVTDLPNKKLEGKNIVTINYEINYLLAYHTNANLLLPSGFPLHSRKTNIEIIKNINTICHYMAVPKSEIGNSINNFNPNYQSNWVTDRTVSEENGFAYNAFHRGAYKKNLCDSLIKLSEPVYDIKVDFVVFEPFLAKILAKQNVFPKWKVYSLIPFDEYKKIVYKNKTELNSI